MSQTHYTILAKGCEISLKCPQQVGYVYLLHFHSKLAHAQHYMGSAANLEARLARHEHGNGARLMEVITQAGISWEIVRIWQCPTVEEARSLESRLKHRHEGPRLCPVCQGKPLDPLAMLYQGHWPFHVFAQVGRRQPMREVRYV